ncbi:hypothetical protein HGRIS_011626 [Hohenbuehelia grisea]|uniref:Uncharacterized protein n=1 Tax=Hohenbuehelia grisea TaxID=104357 RepID=A0ABR3JWM5_9AGAR
MDSKKEEISTKKVTSGDLKEGHATVESEPSSENKTDKLNSDVPSDDSQPSNAQPEDDDDDELENDEDIDMADAPKVTYTARAPIRFAIDKGTKDPRGTKGSGVRR